MLCYLLLFLFLVSQQCIAQDLSRRCKEKYGAGCPCKAQNFSGVYMMKEGQLTCDMCDAGERWSPDELRCQECLGSLTSCKRNVFPGSCNKKSCDEDQTTGIAAVDSLHVNTTSPSTVTAGYNTTTITNGTLPTGETDGHGYTIQADDSLVTSSNIVLIIVVVVTGTSVTCLVIGLVLLYRRCFKKSRRDDAKESHGKDGEGGAVVALLKPNRLNEGR